MKRTHSSFLLETLHSRFKKIYADISEKSWQNQLALFLKEIKFFSGDANEKRIVAGLVAALCERSYYIAAHGKKSDTRLDFKSSLKKITNSSLLPSFLFHPGPIACGKRQPSFAEAILPTIERFQVMERLPEIFGETVDSIIIGGSISYIPFFGIRHNLKKNDFSDIDTLIVVNDKFFKMTSWDGFRRDNIFPQTEKELFLKRLETFKHLLSNNAAEVFSQRFTIKGVPFTISNHFVTNSVFKRMVYTDLKKSLSARKDMQYVMRDFRTSYFSHPCHARHTFSGERHEATIECHETPFGGYISDMPGYIIFGGKLYPGVYQTVISPAFLVFYDRTGKTTKLVGEFEKILYQETVSARKQYPSATYAKAHNRYDIFPPGRYDNGHDSYVSPSEMEKYMPPPNFTCFVDGSEIVQDKARGNDVKALKAIRRLRVEAKCLLGKWKRTTLKDAEKKVEKFISRGNYEKRMLSAKKQKLRWHYVVTIPRTKTVSKTFSCEHNGNGKSISHKAIFTQIITPGDIMRLSAYEKLGRKAGKVYVASIMNPTPGKNNLPSEYALVIPVS